MSFFKKFIDKFHYLSFDVAIGAWIQALAIQKFTQYLFPSDYFILLVPTTLIIYWLDRILDVYKLNNKTILTAKHRLYKNYFYIILTATLLLGSIVIIKGLFFSDITVQKMGVYGSFSVGVYFFIHHVFKGKPQLIFFKELMIAIIYSLILWILPLIYSFSLLNFLGFLCLFFHALLNLWIISLWEKDLDNQMNTHSFAQFIGIEKFIHVLFIITLINCGLLMYWDSYFGLTNFFMLQGHFILFRAKECSFRRIWMEFIFWIPLLYVLLPNYR
ncbi:MAG: hypothetical protein KatS3mg035_0017 [Bacteroidia bacterium]|nr:MAG: hypothetical protein KatS3mg035_0017 [Bacteroidia bacterium]